MAIGPTGAALRRLVGRLNKAAAAERRARDRADAAVRAYRGPAFDPHKVPRALQRTEKSHAAAQEKLFRARGRLGLDTSDLDAVGRRRFQDLMDISRGWKD